MTSFAEIRNRFVLSVLSPFSGPKKRFRSRLPDAVVEAEGLRFAVSPSNNRSDYRIWRDHKSPEPKSTKALQDIVRGRVGLFIDMGANIGAFSLLVGSQMKEGSVVVAFEPNPVVLDRLTKNIALNGLGDRIRVERCALGDTPGAAQLAVHDMNMGMTRVMDEAEPSEGRGHTQSVTVARVTDRLSDLTPSAFDVVCVKADIEGYEDRALAPLLDPESPIKPDWILLEVDHADQWSTDLFQALDNAGYHAVDHMDGNTLYQRAGGEP